MLLRCLKHLKHIMALIGLCICEYIHIMIVCGSRWRRLNAVAMDHTLSPLSAVYLIPKFIAMLKKKIDPFPRHSQLLDGEPKTWDLDGETLRRTKFLDVESCSWGNCASQTLHIDSYDNCCAFVYPCRRIWRQLRVPETEKPNRWLSSRGPDRGTPPTGRSLYPWLVSLLKFSDTRLTKKKKDFSVTTAICRNNHIYIWYISLTEPSVSGDSHRICVFPSAVMYELKYETHFKTLRILYERESQCQTSRTPECRKHSDIDTFPQSMLFSVRCALW